MSECDHPTLIHAAGNNAGVKCLSCGRVWKRRALYVGNSRVSWMGEPSSVLAPAAVTALIDARNAQIAAEQASEEK